MRNPLPLSVCCDYDSLFPYLIASSPSAPVTNTRLFWMVFEFSEPLLLLYNPALSFLENLQLFSVERLLSALCAPGLSGQCISFGNAQVRDAAVASNRLAFQLAVARDGTVTAHIPRELITDWAGNQLKEDVDKSIDVRGSDITLLAAQLLAFSRGSFRPEVRFQFSTAVEIAPNSSRAICSWDGRSASRHCVAPRDTRIRGDAVRVDLDAVYSPRNVYAMSIPPGYLCDRYRNFFEGFAEDSFRVSSRALWPIELAHAANPGWIALALLLFAAGSFIAIAGWGCRSGVTGRYKNVYHSVTAANALLLALVYLGCWLLLFAEWTQQLSPLLVNCIVLVLAALALASSVALIHVSPWLALRLFSATLGFVLGIALERLATDCALYAVGFIAAYASRLRLTPSDLYLAFALLPVIFAVIFAAIPMVWQWQFLAGIAATASGFLVESVFLVIMESLHGTEMLGKSCNLLADGLELLTFGVVGVGVYHVQRKVGMGGGNEAQMHATEQFHEYYFGKGTKTGRKREKKGGKGGKNAKNAKNALKMKKKSKKEEKWAKESGMRRRKAQYPMQEIEEGSRSCITNV